MEWYYILGIISYGIFIIQFILSIFGWGDIDLDIDFDGETDFDVGDLISFKGLVHFTMGFSSWLMAVGKVTTTTISIAVLTGIVFVFFLYLAYQLCMKLNSEPTAKQGVGLIGERVYVYVVLKNDQCICSVIDAPYSEIVCECTTPVQVGQVKTIMSFNSGIYQIS